MRQVKSFTQRKLADALRLRDLGVDMASLLIAAKIAMLELDQVFIILFAPGLFLLADVSFYSPPHYPTLQVPIAPLSHVPAKAPE